MPCAAVAEMYSAYQYQELKHDDEFRLLNIYAGQGAEAIRCSLDHYRLSDHPTYRALSYTWDQVEPGFPLEMSDGTEMRVRENLRDALRSMRDAVSDTLIWCDAICINQADHGERTHQVRLMSEIFRDAFLVVGWLESVDSRLDDPPDIMLIRESLGLHQSIEPLSYYDSRD